MLNAIEKFNITVCNVSEDQNEATLVVEPLERGYGVTLGNSLRRVLLSTIPGYAGIGSLPGRKRILSSTLVCAMGRWHVCRAGGSARRRMLRCHLKTVSPDGTRWM